MSFLSDALASALALPMHLQAPAGPLAVGFSVLLVAWLVAAEEVELRRGRRSPG